MESEGQIIFIQTHGAVKNIDYISTTFLQDTGSWIFFPSTIEYYISNDGVNFSKVYSDANPAGEKNIEKTIKEFDKKLSGIEARYIRVYAENIGVCPQWHVAAGGKAWIFIDEIYIK